MKEAEMTVVDVTLNRLCKIAFLGVFREGAVARGHLDQLEARQALWLARRRSHIHPDDVALFDDRVANRTNLLDEVGLGGLIRHIDACAGDVELPPVIDASQAKFLDAAVDKWSLTMWTQ